MDNVYAAKLLISSGADVNSRDGELWTPLHIASAFSRLDIVKLLLEVLFIYVTMPTTLLDDLTVCKLLSLALNGCKSLNGCNCLITW